MLDLCLKRDNVDVRLKTVLSKRAKTKLIFIVLEVFEIDKNNLIVVKLFKVEYYLT